MELPEVDEKRRSPRYPLDRLAKIQLGIGGPPRICYVTDFSNGGVRVNVYGFELPDEFVLRLTGDGPAQDGTYRVVWRLGHHVGAMFVSALVSEA
jgi:PilZ domain